VATHQSPVDVIKATEIRPQIIRDLFSDIRRRAELTRKKDMWSAAATQYNPGSIVSYVDYVYCTDSIRCLRVPQVDPYPRIPEGVYDYDKGIRGYVRRGLSRPDTKLHAEIWENNNATEFRNWGGDLHVTVPESFSVLREQVYVKDYLWEPVLGLAYPAHVFRRFAGQKICIIYPTNQDGGYMTERITVVTAPSIASCYMLVAPMRNVDLRSSKSHLHRVGPPADNIYQYNVCLGGKIN
jgi:hypothetical protein